MNENIEKIENIEKPSEQPMERSSEKREAASISPENINAEQQRARKIEEKIYGQEEPHQVFSSKTVAPAGNTRAIEVLVEKALKSPGEVEKIVAELKKSGDPYALDAFHDAYMKAINGKL